MRDSGGNRVNLMRLWPVCNSVFNPKQKAILAEVKENSSVSITKPDYH